jgi:hypothetical protein
MDIIYYIYRINNVYYFHEISKENTNIVNHAKVSLIKKIYSFLFFFIFFNLFLILLLIVF